MDVCENVALCVGLAFPKVMEYKLVRFTVAEAQSMIATTNGRMPGRMLFYNEDAPKVEKLSLGRIYRFSARTVNYDEDVLMFYDPDCTRFTELSQKEVVEVDVFFKSRFVTDRSLQPFCFYEV
jgi:hypothetical protein